MKLRPYQTEAINNIATDWETHNSILLVAATGLGKTIIFSALLDKVLKSDKRGIIIAHRKELIDQPMERLEQYFPYLASRAGIVMANKNEYKSDLIIATIQTLASEKRVSQVLDYGKIDFIITDEAHHSTANTYKNLYERLRKDNPNLKHLGVTATPLRSDDDGLSTVFEKVSGKYTISFGIENGFLAPVKFLSIQTGISLQGVKKQMGDFNQKQLSKVFETDNCFELVVESHKKYVDGRQSLAYTTTVQGAYDLAEKFKEAGVRAIAADGKTNKKERSAILERFRGGEYEVLCNCALFTEGLDVPQVSAIHQVRPTQSDSLYTQIIGRALRIFPNKTDAVILDYAPSNTRNIAMLGDILGTPLERKEYIKPDDSSSDDNVEGGFTYDGNEFSFLNGDPMALVAKKLEYLSQSPWVWYNAPDGCKSLGLGTAHDNNERILLLRPSPNGYDLFLVGKKKDTWDWKARQHTNGVFEDIFLISEDIANQWGNAKLAKEGEAWRSTQASEPQKKLAKKLNVQGVTKHTTKGTIAKMITHGFAIKAISRLS